MCNFSADGDYMGTAGSNEIASSENFHKGMGQQFIEIALGNLQGDAAVVQGWESQTAQAQASRGYDEPVYQNLWTETDYGGFNQQVQTGTRHVGGLNDPLAGYTTEQRARAQGQWLGSNPGDARPGNAGGIGQASSQTARPIVLDLDGPSTGSGQAFITTAEQDGSRFRYCENNSYLRIFNGDQGAVFLEKTPGNAANKINGGKWHDIF